MKTPSWRDLLVPLGTIVDGSEFLLAPYAYDSYPSSTRRRVYVPHAAVREDGSLLLLSQVLSASDIYAASEDEGQECDPTVGYLLCGWVPAGKWFWADPEKRANPTPAPEVENVVPFPREVE